MATHAGTKAEISTQWTYPVTEVRVLVASAYKLVQEVTKSLWADVQEGCSSTGKVTQCSPSSCFTPELTLHQGWSHTGCYKKQEKKGNRSNTRKRDAGRNVLPFRSPVSKGGEGKSLTTEISLCEIPDQLQESLPSLPTTVSCPCELAVISCSAH